MRGELTALTCHSERGRDRQREREVNCKRCSNPDKFLRDRERDREREREEVLTQKNFCERER